ncbi:hypothetical protein SGLAM104S_05446 [Streptomyces glaucescens]
MRDRAPGEGTSTASRAIPHLTSGVILPVLLAAALSDMAPAPDGGPASPRRGGGHGGRSSVGTRERGITTPSTAAAPPAGTTPTSGLPPSERQVSAMSDPHPPPGAKLLPDGVHRSIRPGTAFLRLTTTHERQGLLDGAWWPRSRDVAAELPGLITALTERLGPITRIGLDSAAWNELPTRIIVDDRGVHIDSFAVGDDTALVPVATRTSSPCSWCHRGRPWRRHGPRWPKPVEAAQPQAGPADPDRHHHRGTAPAGRRDPSSGVPRPGSDRVGGAYRPLPGGPHDARALVSRDPRRGPDRGRDTGGRPSRRRSAPPLLPRPSSVATRQAARAGPASI